MHRARGGSRSWGGCSGRGRTARWTIGIGLFIALLVIAVVSSAVLADQLKLRVRRALGAPSDLAELIRSATATLGFDDLLSEEIFRVTISGDPEELFALEFDFIIDVPDAGIQNGGISDLVVACLQMPAKGSVSFSNDESISVSDSDVQITGDLADALRDDTQVTGPVLTNVTEDQLSGLGNLILDTFAIPAMDLEITVILRACALPANPGGNLGSESVLLQVREVTFRDA